MQDFSSYFLRMLNYLSTISFWDVIDILIVAYLFYKVIDLVRKTSSYNLAKGILLLLIFLWLSGPSVFNLTMINFILRKAVEIGLIALVIIFQPELRKLLSRMGSKDFYGISDNEQGRIRHNADGFGLRADVKNKDRRAYHLRAQHEAQ